MRKALLLFTLSLSTLYCEAQITDTTVLRNYINSNIVPNSTRSITATHLNNIFNGIINVMPPMSKTIFNSNGRILQDRTISGFVNNTTRNSLTFDTLSRFEVRTYGNFGAIDPSFFGMRIILSQGSGVMSMGWQTAAGFGNISILPGGITLSGQQGTTDNRVHLGLDGNRFVLYNPTTTGTNSLFRIDRADAAITMFGYPNPGGNLYLSTDTEGKLKLVSLPNIGTGIRPINASTAITYADNTLVNRALSGQPVISLPIDANYKGHRITIVEASADPSNHGCSWTPAARYDNSTYISNFTHPFVSTYMRVTLQFDGTDWWIIGN